MTGNHLRDFRTSIVRSVSHAISASVDHSTGAIEDRTSGSVQLPPGEIIDEWIDQMVSSAALTPSGVRVVPHPSSQKDEASQTQDSMIDVGDLAHAETMPKIADSRRMASALADGSTLIVGYLQFLDPIVRELCWTVANAIGYPIGATLFVSPPDAAGFIPHFDAGDNFVLQLRGHKKWTFFEEHAPRTASSAPWRTPGRYIDPGLTDNPTPTRTDVLGPGDTVCFPSGTIHDVNGFSDVSVHITFVLLPITSADIDSARTHALNHTTQQSRVARYDLATGQVQAQAPRNVIPTSIDSSVKQLERRAQENLLRAAYKTLPDAPLPFSTTLALMSETFDPTYWTVNHQAYFTVYTENDQTTTILHRRGKMAIDTSVIEQVMSGRFSVDGLARDDVLPREQGRKLVRALVMNGILVRAEEGSLES